jgi:hypothetical protein
MTAVERKAIQAEALSRAANGQSWANYPAIIEGFMARGIPEGDIKPRENVFTYQAWRALGRQVRRGEHGIKVTTWVPMTKTNPDTGEKVQIGRRAWTATVFHITQTDPMNGRRGSNRVNEDGPCSDFAYEDSCRVACGL